MKVQAKRKSPWGEESVEAKRSPSYYGFGDSAKDFGNALTRGIGDLVSSTPKSVLEQFLGSENRGGNRVDGGQMQEGEEVSLAAEQQAAVQEAENIIKQGREIKQSREHLEYFRREVDTVESKSKQEQEAERARFEELKAEISKLIKETKELQNEFRNVSSQIVTEKTPRSVGKYHQTFFEWIILQIQVARTRIEEGKNWLRVFSSKKKQKQYWNMFKKHGTTFGLSNERTVATQTG